MKRNVVPPSISMDGRVRRLRTNTGVWNGGLGPDAPCHSGSRAIRGSQTSRTHDLGADPRIELLREGVVDAATTGGLPPAGGDIHSCSRSPA